LSVLLQWISNRKIYSSVKDLFLPERKTWSTHSWVCITLTFEVTFTVPYLRGRPVSYLCQQSLPTARRTSQENSSWCHQSNSSELLWVTYWCLERVIPRVTHYRSLFTLHEQIYLKVSDSSYFQHWPWCLTMSNTWLTSVSDRRYMVINRKALEEFKLRY
jgi:hypothetical protein